MSRKAIPFVAVFGFLCACAKTPMVAVPAAGIDKETTNAALLESEADRANINGELARAARLYEQACRAGSLESCSNATNILRQWSEKLSIHAFACKTYRDEGHCMSASAIFGGEAVPIDRARELEFRILSGDVEGSEQLVDIATLEARIPDRKMDTKEKIAFIEAVATLSDRLGSAIESATTNDKTARERLEERLKEKCRDRIVQLEEIYQGEGNFSLFYKRPSTKFCPAAQ